MPLRSIFSTLRVLAPSSVMPYCDHAQGRNILQQLGGREQQSGLTCPSCRGGTAEERSVTAWRNGLELRAKCWRNKCGWWGSWDVLDVGGLAAVGQPQQARAKRYLLDTLPLTDATTAALEARYGLQTEALRRYGLRQTTSGLACYCPVQGPGGTFRGWVRRWLHEPTRNGPKVKGFPAPGLSEGEAWQGWFRPPATLPGIGNCGPVFCVEDVFSAMRLAQAGHTAVSLLGVAMSATKVLELRAHGGPIVVALDADAYSRAIDYGVRYTVHVRRLEVDIKDMTEGQLTEWINLLRSSLLASHQGTPAQ